MPTYALSQRSPGRRRAAAARKRSSSGEGRSWPYLADLPLAAYELVGDLIVRLAPLERAVNVLQKVKPAQRHQQVTRDQGCDAVFNLDHPLTDRVGRRALALV